MTNSLKIITALLIVLLIVIGAGIFMEKGKTTRSTVKNTADSKTIKASIYNAPSATSSAAEKKAFYDLVMKQAVATSTINIGACRPKPVVVSIEKGEKITFVNNDATKHTVTFNRLLFFEVPGKGTYEFTADVNGKEGIFGYGCGSSRNAVGRIVIQ